MEDDHLRTVLALVVSVAFMALVTMEGVLPPMVTKGQCSFWRQGFRLDLVVDMVVPVSDPACVERQASPG